MISITFIGPAKVEFSIFRVFLLCLREHRRGNNNNSHLGKKFASWLVGERQATHM